MGNQQQAATNQATNIPPRRPLRYAFLSGCLQVFKYIIVPVIVSVVVAFFTASFMGQVQVSDYAAHSFLSSYYRKVVIPADRLDLFKNTLTKNFRSFPGRDWNHYERFWASQQSVTVDSVIPVQGDSSEFTVVLTYKKRDANAPVTSTMDVWLQCHGNIFTGRLPGVGCSPENLQIDNTQSAVTGQ
jgi:hypothetical protein